MLTNSPWARPSSVALSGPATDAVTAAGNSGADPGTPPPLSEGGGGRGGRSGGGRAGGGAPAAEGVSTTFVARWQSALPVKQAFVRLKYGAQAATSPEARQALEHEETNYLIVLSGPLRSFLRGDPETLKKTIMDMTSLSVKGKEAVKPTDLQIALNQRSSDIVFFFPRSAPFTLDDKEVEFSTKTGDVTLKYKFRLKDMVYNGKLEL